MPILLVWAGAGILGAFGIGYAAQKTKEATTSIIPLVITGAGAFLVITHPEVLNVFKKGIVK